jgi:molybdopterin/thiamine biosynthesis adenylyltransferase
MDEFLRQRDLLTPHDIVGCDVDLAGAGALGGGILLVLIKMGFGVLSRITLSDFDTCTRHNLSNQWFTESHAALGQAKVEALAEMVAWIGERDLVPVQARFTGDEPRPLGPVVILAVDSLEERARIWSRLKRRDDVRFLIDARMGAQVLEVYALDLERDDREAYERSLVVSEGGSFEEPCTQRAIFYTVLGAASFVGSILRSYCRSEPYSRHVAFDFRNFMIEVRDPA